MRMKAMEVGLDMSRSLPLSFNPFNLNNAAWNYLWIGGTKDHRSKLVSSMALGSLIRDSSVFISIISSGLNEEYKRVMDVRGGSTIDLSSVSFNIFNYNLWDTYYTPSYSSFLTEKMLENKKMPSSIVLNNLNWFLSNWSTEGQDNPEQLMKNEIDKNFPGMDSFFIKNYENTMPSFDFLNKRANFISKICKVTDEPGQGLILESLRDYYIQNKDTPSFSSFLNYLNVFDEHLFSKIKREVSSDLFCRLNSDDDLKLSDQGNYFFASRNYLDEENLLLGLMVSLDFTQRKKGSKKIFIVDGKENKCPIFLKSKIHLSRISRKSAISFHDVCSSIDVEGNRSQEKMAWLMNFQGVFMLNQKDKVSDLVESLGLNYFKTPNLVNYLKFNIGIKEESKDNAGSYESQNIEKSKPSLSMAKIYAKNMGEEVSLKEIKSRFLDCCLISSKEKKGFWFVKEQDLMETDLMFLDKEIKNQGLSEAVIILDKVIDEHVLYEKYSFKKVKHKMVFLSIEDLYKEIENFQEKEVGEIHRVKNRASLKSCILYIDFSGGGIQDLEV